MPAKTTGQHRSTYIRRYNLKDTANDQQVEQHWKFLLNEFIPAINKIDGVHSARVYTGAGALRADIRLVVEMEHAGIYDNILHEPTITPHLGHFYGPIDMTTTKQEFIREATPELLRNLQGQGQGGGASRS